ncbi:MAG: nuclear transport factor 2 family protein [Solirubrobacterales bacterium]
MSQKNIEIVRHGTEGFVRGDWDAATSALDPQCEWIEMPSLGPDAASYTGLDEIRQAVGSWTGKWSDYDAEVLRYADAGNDVVVLSRERGRGVATGATVERELGQVFTLREGKVVRARLYGSWAEALEAAGMSE